MSLTPRQQKRLAVLLTRRRQEQKWMAEHGTTLTAYIERYGSASDPEHYGNGGEAIYAADKAVLDKIETELADLMGRILPGEVYAVDGVVS